MRNSKLTIGLAVLVLVLGAAFLWQWYVSNRMLNDALKREQVRLDQDSRAVEELRQSIDSFEKSVSSDDAKRIAGQLRQRMDDYQEKVRRHAQ